MGNNYGLRTTCVNVVGTYTSLCFSQLMSPLSPLMPTSPKSSSVAETTTYVSVCVLISGGSAGMPTARRPGGTRVRAARPSCYRCEPDARMAAAIPRRSSSLIPHFNNTTYDWYRVAGPTVAAPVTYHHQQPINNHYRHHGYRHHHQQQQCRGNCALPTPARLRPCYVNNAFTHY